MEEVKYIHDIRNGDLVVTRDKERYIKIDKYLVGTEGWIGAFDYQINNDLVLEMHGFSRFDIIEIWSPVDVMDMLSFDFEDRELVWKEKGEEQKYYLKHKWLYVNGNTNFLNVYSNGLGLGLNSKDNIEGYKTQFTKQEIEKIKKEYNTDLKDFEIIPVEEI